MQDESGNFKMNGDGSENQDANIIRNIQNGDRVLFANIFHTHYSGLCAFVLRYTGSFEVSEDIIQDIFLSIWQNRKTWSPATGLKPYLYKAARNSALDYHRHNKVKRKWETESRYLELSHVESPEDNLKDREANKEIASAIEEAIDRLPESRKIIFLLSREDGLTYKEIAEVLNVSVKTVETQMGRSIKTLRQYLVEYLPFFLLLFQF